MLTNENFKEVLANEKLSIVSFSANGCASCVAMYQTLQNYRNIAQVYTLDAHDFPAMFDYYNLDNINSTLILNYGKILGVVKGYQPDEIFGLYMEAMIEKMEGK